MPVTCICQNPKCGNSFTVPPSVFADGRQYCSQACRYHKSRTELFWEKVRICEHGSTCQTCCWLWQSGKNPAGYGLFTDKLHGHKTRIPAQRIAWELANAQPLPSGMWGLHICDNPPCCNPAHIYPGTARDNQQDALKRGRARHARGELHARHKLTAKDVLAIRQRVAHGEKQSILADELHVSRATICLIVHRRLWRESP